MCWYKQKENISRINYAFSVIMAKKSSLSYCIFVSLWCCLLNKLITTMILGASWNIRVDKYCVVGCRSNYSEETLIPACSIPRKDEDPTNTCMRYVNRKDRESSFNSFIGCISHFEETFYK